MEVIVNRNVFSIEREVRTWLDIEGVEQSQDQWTVYQYGKEVCYYDASIWKTVGRVVDEFMEYMEIEMK